MSTESRPEPQPAVSQFMRFCIVGASSFLIDAGVSGGLTFRFKLAWMLAKTISFTLAVTNGFFWNQRWTFKARGHRPGHTQYAMFVGVNIVGLILSLLLMDAVFFGLTGHARQPHPSRGEWLAATVIATLFVTVWNYLANRRWTFARPA